MDVTHAMGIFIVLGLAWVSAFFRFSVIVWTVVLGVALLFTSIRGYLSLLPMLVFWLLYLAAALFANLTSWRQRRIISPALKQLQKQMPSISATERTAIEAGDTWWEKELFCGRPDWKKLFAIPRPTLSTEEQHFLNNQVEHLCSLINEWRIVNQESNLSPEVWDYLKKEKFFGMVIPKEYGGLGFSALTHSTVVTKIATRSISTAVSTMVPNSLGPAELLLHYGTEEQKSHYLPRLANGTDIPCFALTGTDAGSDAGSITDTGVICRGQFEGRETIGIRLNWDKRYITLAPVATVLGVAFHLYDPEHLMGDNENIGITLCLIPTSHPGVELGNRHYPMYLSFMNGPTRGKDVFIPLDWIIGGASMAGQGWRMLMECLSIGRSISLPALATACGKLSYRVTGAYARVRRQFNTPIATFEGIEEALGYVAGYTYLLEATRMMTAGAIDQKINPSIVSAIAKYHMTEMARQVVSHAMDVHSGQMIQVGPRNLLANVYLAVPISITVEGANILTRNLIIFGQGAIRCHPYILKEVEIISAANPDVKELDQVLMSHIGFFISNLARSFAYGLTGGFFIISHAKDKRIRRLKRQLTRMSAALALLADTSLILLGGSLKRRERISARLGDIMSQLYLASAVLKYFHDNNKPSTDIDYVCWSVQECLYKIQVACDDLLKNFPTSWVGSLLKFIIFPFGRAYQKPNDKLHSTLVASMLAPSEFRDRLTQYCYISDKEDDLGCRLDKAIKQVATIDPVWKKLHKAVQSGAIPSRYDFDARLQKAEELGMLSAEESRMLSEYEALRLEIVKVNEFSFNLETVIA
jgi:acyl-CoA dehydrogenase